MYLFNYFYVRVYLFKQINLITNEMMKKSLSTTQLFKMNENYFSLNSNKTEQNKIE